MSPGGDHDPPTFHFFSSSSAELLQALDLRFNIVRLDIDVYAFATWLDVLDEIVEITAKFGVPFVGFEIHRSSKSTTPELDRSFIGVAVDIE